MSDLDDKYDRLYDGEPWAELALQAGFRPSRTESSARSAFAFCARRIETAEIRVRDLETGLLDWLKSVQGEPCENVADERLRLLAEAILDERQALAKGGDGSAAPESDVVIEIDEIGGNCPVQAEGRIGGEPFYFRARGDSWSIGIGGKPIGEPDWFYREPYGAGFEAGWMEVTEARAFIEQAARAWAAEKAGPQLEDSPEMSP